MSNNSLQLKKSASIFPNIAVVAAIAILPFVLNGVGFTYGLTIANFAAIYIIAVSGLDIVFGYSGQISMGHAAFYAIGAYGSALLNIHFKIPVVLTMIIAALLAALVGALLAYPASKLVFHFLALATTAFGEIVYQLALQSPGGITGNAIGLPTPPINFFGINLTSSFSFYFFAYVCVIIFVTIKQNIVNSRTGRAFIAIRENSHSAEGMGIDVRKYKVLAFSISAFFTAFAGAMYAHMAGYISADSFTNKQSVMFITMLLFGGTASKAGPIIGSIAVLLLNEALRSLENMQLLVYGIILLLIIMAMPGGIYGVVQDVVTRVKSRKGTKNA